MTDLCIVKGHARRQHEGTQSLARRRKHGYYEGTHTIVFLYYSVLNEYQNTTITSYPDLEPSAIGTYDDTVLNLLDGIMVKAHSFGIKVDFCNLYFLPTVALTPSKASH